MGRSLPSEKKRRLGISDQGKHISKGMEGISHSFTTLGGCKISKVLRGYDLNLDLSILSCYRQTCMPFPPRPPLPHSLVSRLLSKCQFWMLYFEFAQSIGFLFSNSSVSSSLLSALVFPGAVSWEVGFILTCQVLSQPGRALCL